MTATETAPIKRGTIPLIRDFFQVGPSDIRMLSPVDRQQLGSAIARSLSMDASQCEFELMDY